MAHHQIALLQEVAGHVDAFIKKSARVLAQIQDQAFDPAVILLLEIIDGLFNRVVSALLKGADADIANEAIFGISFGYILRQT